jgi:hypothetical protein
MNNWMDTKAIRTDFVAVDQQLEILLACQRLRISIPQSERINC